MEYDIRNGKFLFKRAVDTFTEPDMKSFPDHYHTEYELLYMLSGDSFFSFKSVRYHMTPRCLQVVKPGEFHHVEVTPNIPYDRIVIRFSEADIPIALRSPIKELMPLYNTVNSNFSKALFELETICKNMTGDLLICGLTSHLNILLGYLLTGEDKPKSPIYSDEKIKTVLNYIDNNLVNLHSVSDVSKGLFMSKTNLNQLFATQLNTGIMEYIRTQKCMLAQSLLSNGKKATEVYSLCGFKEYSSFYRNYIKVFGEAPTVHVKR